MKPLVPRSDLFGPDGWCALHLAPCAKTEGNDDPTPKAGENRHVGIIELDIDEPLALPARELVAQVLLPARPLRINLAFPISWAVPEVCR